MSFFIHFKTEFDAILEINTLTPLILQESATSTVSLEVAEQYPLIIKVTPLLEKFEHKKLLPYATKLSVDNGILEKSSSLLQVTEYPYNNYEVKFLKNCMAEHKKPDILAQYTYTVKAKEHTATVFFDGIYQISIQDKDLLFSKEILPEINNVTMEKLKNKDILILEAKTKKGENYSLILMCKNNNYEVVVEDYIEKIEHTADTLTTLKKQNDMAGHGIVCEYELKNDNVIKKDEYAVYINEKPKITSMPELIPFSFLEAVKVKNYALARTYLTDELNESLQDEHLEAYFGEYVDISTVEYEQNNKNKIALIFEGKKRQAKVFEVVFQKNKISNFSEG